MVGVGPSYDRVSSDADACALEEHTLLAWPNVVKEMMDLMLRQLLVHYCAMLSICALSFCLSSCSAGYPMYLLAAYALLLFYNRRLEANVISLLRRSRVVVQSIIRDDAPRVHNFDSDYVSMGNLSHPRVLLVLGALDHFDFFGDATLPGQIYACEQQETFKVAWAASWEQSGLHCLRFLSAVPLYIVVSGILLLFVFVMQGVLAVKIARSLRFRPLSSIESWPFIEPCGQTASMFDKVVDGQLPTRALDELDAPSFQVSDAAEYELNGIYERVRDRRQGDRFVYSNHYGCTLFCDSFSDTGVTGMPTVWYLSPQDDVSAWLYASQSKPFFSLDNNQHPLLSLYQTHFLKKSSMSEWGDDSAFESLNDVCYVAEAACMLTVEKMVRRASNHVRSGHVVLEPGHALRDGRKLMFKVLGENLLQLYFAVLFLGLTYEQKSWFGRGLQCASIFTGLASALSSTFLSEPACACVFGVPVLAVGGLIFAKFIFIFVCPGHEWNLFGGCVEVPTHWSNRTAPHTHSPL